MACMAGKHFAPTWWWSHQSLLWIHQKNVCAHVFWGVVVWCLFQSVVFSSKYLVEWSPHHCVCAGVFKQQTKTYCIKIFKRNKMLRNFKRGFCVACRNEDICLEIKNNLVLWRHFWILISFVDNHKGMVSNSFSYAQWYQLQRQNLLIKRLGISIS